MLKRSFFTYTCRQAVLGSLQSHCVPFRGTWCLFHRLAHMAGVRAHGALRAYRCVHTFGGL